jgi:hypothetical protein
MKLCAIHNIYLQANGLHNTGIVPTFSVKLINKFLIDHRNKMKNSMWHVAININTIKMLYNIKIIRANISSGPT